MYRLRPTKLGFRERFGPMNATHFTELCSYFIETPIFVNLIWFKYAQPLRFESLQALGSPFVGDNYGSSFKVSSYHGLCSIEFVKSCQLDHPVASGRRLQV
jgi:hypothetical protein